MDRMKLSDQQPAGRDVRRGEQLTIRAAGVRAGLSPQRGDRLLADVER